MTFQIRHQSTHLLLPHPRQEEIYGATEVDRDFVASIVDRGILQPLIIYRARPEDEGYTVISGHRRLEGARQAGLNTVPVILKEYKNEDEAVLDLIVSNKNREKTNHQRITEFLKLKQTLCQLTELKMHHKSLVSLISENEDLGRILQGYEIDPEKPLTTIEILEGITGISEYKQKAMTVIYSDEYLGEQIEKLRQSGAGIRILDELYASVMDVRTQHGDGKISLYEAMKSIRDAIESRENKLKKNKPASPPKARKEKPEPEAGEFDDDKIEARNAVKEFSKAARIKGGTYTVHEMYQYMEEFFIYCHFTKI